MIQSFEFAEVDLRKSTSDLSKCETIISEKHEFVDVCNLVVLRAHWTDFQQTKKFSILIMTQSFEFADMDLRQSASELSNSKCETTIREDFCRVILRAHWFNVRATYLWFIICISL